MLVRSDFMAIEWSGLSPELLVRLDRSASQPLRAQLEEQGLVASRTCGWPVAVAGCQS